MGGGGQVLDPSRLGGLTARGLGMTRLLGVGWVEVESELDVGGRGMGENRGMWVGKS